MNCIFCANWLLSCCVLWFNVFCLGVGTWCDVKFDFYFGLLTFGEWILRLFSKMSCKILILASSLILWQILFWKTCRMMPTLTRTPSKYQTILNTPQNTFKKFNQAGQNQLISFIKSSHRMSTKYLPTPKKERKVMRMNRLMRYLCLSMVILCNSLTFI